MSKKKSVPNSEETPIIHPAVVILKDAGLWKNGTVVQTSHAEELITDGNARAANALDAATAGVSFPAAAFEAAAKLPVPTPDTKKET